MRKKFQPFSLYLTLGKVALFTFALMSVYQFVKDTLFPEITLAESHINTILFTTLLATTAAYFALRKQQSLLTMLVAETAERQEAEEAMKKSEEKFRSIVELANEGILQVDSSSKITYVNRTMAGMLGYSAAEMLDRSLADFHFPEDLEKYRSRMAEREQGRGGRYECRLRHRDGGPRWVLVSATAKRNEDGKSAGSFAMFTDITERKQAEEELQRHTEDLARLHRKLDAANREANLYLDILTHDIRNTENVSNLYAELLIDTQDEAARAYTEKLQQSIRKSIEILRNVSTIRRIHRPSDGQKRVNLDEVVQGEIAHFPEKITHCDAARCQVWADDLLSEVFANLIGNAVKFGGSGVEVAIRIEEEAEVIRVSVEDTGPGIPDTDKQAVFHRYEQKRRGVGEGLGLFLVQVLIERYGGTIWADDRVAGRPEEGTAFRFTLRKAGQDSPAA